MAIGVTTTVTAPIETYDAIHAAMLRHEMPSDIGLITHAARETADGFEIIEVWTSKEAFETTMQQIMPAILRGVMGDAAQSGPEPRTEMWDVRGLVVPSAGLAV